MVRGEDRRSGEKGDAVVRGCVLRGKVSLTTGSWSDGVDWFSGFDGGEHSTVFVCVSVAGEAMLLTEAALIRSTVVPGRRGSRPSAAFSFGSFAFALALPMSGGQEGLISIEACAAGDEVQ